MGRIFVGTSGWQYRHWQGVFYPENLKQKDWLLYYTSYFDTVEVNATFYHQMKKETFTKWRKITGEDFVFSIKGSRLITHIKRLNNCQKEVENFFASAEGLKGKKANLVLWQFSAAMRADKERLKNFLKLLPSSWRQAFEFRHQSWLNQEIYDLLKKYDAAWVIQDSPYWPKAEVQTASFFYFRFHGGKNLYASCYSKKELDSWREKMREWAKKGFDIYAYFNNDAQGYAVKNALELKRK